ncbi:hypothetical protein H9W91_18415 [Streptomyces alfalfae]|uniref:hypothetical protein n=1 Tax=Streptomyces alfalfae TaxID=1642299 RepID=UPI001BAA7893|nr:hypothetical protein [Streptomyces alfalfae]QUI32612.1 hypothetical protein H9W91_18415 [Streptomyces alfalfae]
METCTVAGEHERLSAWFAAATPSPADSMSAWSLAPDFPRRLPTGVNFDVVLAHRALVELAYDILRRYEQTVGPAVRFTNLTTAAVLVPPGTTDRWSGLVAGSSWPDWKAVPTCLGRGHAVRIPGIALLAQGIPVEWLEKPNTESVIGDAPLLTSPAQLVRCLAEARSLLAPEDERSPLTRAVSAVRAVLRAPQRT